MTKKKSRLPSTLAESAVLAKCVLVSNALIAPLYPNRVVANAPTPPSGYVYFSTHVVPYNIVYPPHVLYRYFEQLRYACIMFMCECNVNHHHCSMHIQTYSYE